MGESSLPQLVSKKPHQSERPEGKGGGPVTNRRRHEKRQRVTGHLLL